MSPFVAMLWRRGTGYQREVLERLGLEGVDVSRLQDEDREEATLAAMHGCNWWRELESNSAMTVEDLARREGITAAYVVRIVRLAFLSPATLKSIFDGTLPAYLTVKRLTAPDAVPARWDH